MLIELFDAEEKTVFQELKKVRFNTGAAIILDYMETEYRDRELVEQAIEKKDRDALKRMLGSVRDMSLRMWIRRYLHATAPAKGE